MAINTNGISATNTLTHLMPALPSILGCLLIPTSSINTLSLKKPVYNGVADSTNS